MLWILALVCTLLATGCRSTPESAPVSLTRGETVLARATREVGALGDPAEQVAIFETIAEGMRRAGNTTDARAVAREAVRLARELPATPEGVELRLALAAVLLRLEEPALARELIRGATDYARGVLEEPIRAELLVSIVESALTSVEDTRDLLPAIVDEVYVIENADLRATTLIAVAETYQRVGVGQSVAGLINQAIPAIRSVQNANRRALLFARVSFRALEAGDLELAVDLIDDATEQLTEGETEVSRDTAEIVVRALTATDQTDRAARLVSGSDSPTVRAAGYLSIARELSRAGPATQVLEQAVTAAEEVSDAGQYVDLMVGIAMEYQRRGLRGAAARVGGYAASRARGQPGIANQLQELEGLARVYAAADQLAEIRSFISEIADPYVRSVLSVTVAERLRAIT